MIYPIAGGWFGVAGAVIFFIGAAIATSVGAWDLTGVQLLQTVHQSVPAWRWGNLLLSLGTMVSAIGMKLVASSDNSLLIRSGAILWITASVSGIVGFLFQGEFTILAARTWSEIGTTPSWFMLLAKTSGIAIGIFMIVGIIGSIEIGWWFYNAYSLSITLLTTGVGVLIIAVIFAVMDIPAAAILTSCWIAVVCLIQNSA